MSIGRFIKCDREVCHNEHPLSDGATDLPQGWLQGFDRREPFGAPVYLHFCSANCSYMHTIRMEQDEKAASIPLEESLAEAVAS